MWPAVAISLKHILHSPKSRIKPRFRPHRKQRRTIRVWYFGFFLLRAMTDVFGMMIIF